MRILLLGEFSGLFKNLKEGLLELGHDVKLGSNGDKWKKIQGADFELYKYSNSSLGKITNYIFNPYKDFEKFSGYDIVQLVNTFIFHPYVNLNIIKKIKKNNDKIFLSAAGGDYSVYKAYTEGIYKYYMYDDNKELDKKYANTSMRSILRKKNDITVSNLVDGIIPISYEYAVAYKNHLNLKKTIPIPINIKNIKYKDNIINDKIVIFHGLNQENAKGTKFIKEAMEIIKERHKDEVEIIIDGKMPLEQYLNVIDRSNIIIDQCKSYGYGLNALYSMAKGKIVMSGAESETLNDIDIKKCPVINIRPEVNDIVNKLEILIENKKNISQIGYESREFVETYHDYIKIAQKYINCWNSSLV